jgi:Glycosyltransferase
MTQKPSKIENQDQVIIKKNIGCDLGTMPSEGFHRFENIRELKKGNNKSNKILMAISYPDTRLKKELESLKKSGYKVSLIIWERSWPFILDGDVEVKSLKLDVPVGHVKTLFYFPVWWAFLLFWMLIMKWDVLHAVNFDTYFFSIIVAKIKRKPVVYDIFDFYGDVMEGFLRPLISNMDNFTMKFADVIIIADDSRIYQIGQNIKNKIITINNAPEENLFRKNSKYEGDNKFKIFLGGKITGQRCTDLIISAIKGMENVQLIIKGYCGEEEYISKLSSLTKDMKNVTMDLNGVLYDEIIQNTLNADLTLALYDPGIPNNVYASPNKLFEAMASGIPIIVNENTSMANIVQKENCGIVIPFGDKESLIEAISCLKDNKSLRRKLGDNGRKAYENKYNWEIMENRLNSIYHQVLDGK